MHPPLTRAAGLARWAQFRPRAAHYAETRNYDEGPPHPGVSGLSPWLSAGLLDEAELLRDLVGVSGDTQKFADEVRWRTYMLGHLELHPAAWTSYRAELQRVRANLTGGQAVAVRRALAGATGIACFDAWVAELADTGYLHNHARMWFASIWIFTLRLPWEVGAAHFFSHLRDGDAASNTLGWRWVGGLHTPGKHYVARADNIARYTRGRFAPHGQLQEDPAPLAEARRPARQPLEPLPNTLPTSILEKRWGLLLWPGALPRVHQDGWEGQGTPTAVATLWTPAVADEHELSPAVRSAHAEALADARHRAATRWPLATIAELAGTSSLSLAQAVESWARQHHLVTVVWERPARGPWTPSATAVAEHLRACGVAVVELRSAWRTALWPHAARGFFNFRQGTSDLLPKLLTI